jgi:hypothetical protein
MWCDLHGRAVSILTCRKYATVRFDPMRVWAMDVDRIMSPILCHIPYIGIATAAHVVRLASHVRVVLVVVLSTVPYESLTPLTYVFSEEHILVLPVLRCVNDIDGTFL